MSQIVLLPSPPDTVAAPDGVQLSWNGGGNSKFRIFRGTGDEKPAPLAESDTAFYSDTSAAFDTAYRYFIQAIQGKAESLVSEIMPIKPEDKFPPAVPAGLIASTGSGSV